ncbi:MAG: glutamate--tRNA ligase [Chloroflexi bacterium]|nr:glutamate--tRNA ligase [Chloroflexota bacterium]
MRQPNESSDLRARYAPSPTGFPHVGNIRTALFNWLFARHYGGRFIVRIEDTDLARLVPGATNVILESLRWLGLDWDEGPEVGGDYGPYFQSQRLDLYRDAAQRLVREDSAYHCFCSPQRLEEMRAEQLRRKQPPKYDRRCRELSLAEAEKLRSSGIVPVVRFKTPPGGETTFQDLIRGTVTFDVATLDDFVLLKSDGYPTYHLASIVDDRHMRISHVLRADEWVSSTPRHMLLYQAMGWEPPLFAHLPMILGRDRAKLSKRHGAASITEFRDMGFLPEAMLNFLALLGWSLDDKTELFTREELVQHFSLERIGKTAAIFDLEKLEWMNGLYVRKLSTERFAALAMPFLERILPKEAPPSPTEDYVLKLAPLVQERAKKLSECADLADFFFVEELVYDPCLLLAKDASEDMVLGALKAALGRLRSIEAFDAATLEGILRPLALELGVKTGLLFGALRTATTGRTAAPPLFQTMAVLGKERCLRRIEAAIAKLGQPAGG